eukprot:12745002-Alexandrium_andersonii.AAC.1
MMFVRRAASLSVWLFVCAARGAAGADVPFGALLSGGVREHEDVEIVLSPPGAECPRAGRTRARRAAVTSLEESEARAREAMAALVQVARGRAPQVPAQRSAAPPLPGRRQRFGGRERRVRGSVREPSEG